MDFLVFVARNNSKVKAFIIQYFVKKLLMWNPILFLHCKSLIDFMFFIHMFVYSFAKIHGKFTWN